MNPVSDPKSEKLRQRILESAVPDAAGRGRTAPETDTGTGRKQQAAQFPVASWNTAGIHSGSLCHHPETLLRGSSVVCYPGNGCYLVDENTVCKESGTV